jgi:hypothetical protein
MKPLIRKVVLSAGLAMAICLTLASSALKPVRADGPGCGTNGNPCTISGTSYGGTCINNDDACGCSTTDGTELGPSQDCNSDDGGGGGIGLPQ